MGISNLFFYYTVDTDLLKSSMAVYKMFDNDFEFRSYSNKLFWTSKTNYNNEI